MEQPPPDNPSDVDHMLLESLFYNEMMLMEESPSLLLSVLAADGTPAVDADALAETALLGEFGVVGQNAHSRQKQERAQPAAAAPPHALAPSAAQPAVAAKPTSFHSGWQGVASMPQQAASMVSALPPGSSPLTATASAVSVASQVSTQPPASVSSQNPVPVAPTPTAASAITKQGANSDPDATAARTPSDPEKRKKLESQFATLASRLGINLPSELMPSLAAATTATTTTTTTTDVSSETKPHTANPPEPPPPQVQELQHTAQAAIEAVTRKRTATAAAEPSKRRKKPRLVDCERKLAALKAENAMLKRHLHTISNQSHQLQQEQRAAELQIRKLWTSQASEQELDAAVKDFTELYSDYGKRRQTELQFHLEQLGQLANPTEVTKMGLWTLGQQSTLQKNRIAGLLQKELGITPQQGRKIVEQREKIRIVMANLKESLRLLKKLNSLCEHKTRIFHDRLSKCRQILTPRQVVKLILWIDDHSQLLDRVCPGWGSEQLVSKGSAASPT